MPTTLGHVIAGYAVAEATSSRERSANSTWSVVLLAVFVANAPDLDFIPGLLVDNIPHYHRTMTHGLPAALVFATGLTVALQSWWQGSRTSLWTLIFVAYFSHIVLDVVTPDPTGGYGVRFLWPFASTWLVYPLPFLEPFNAVRMLDHGPTNDTFWPMLFSGRAIVVFLVDALIALPLILVGKAVGRASLGRYGNRTTTETSSIQ